MQSSTKIFYYERKNIRMQHFYPNLKNIYNHYFDYKINTIASEIIQLYIYGHTFTFYLQVIIKLYIYMYY